MLLICSYSPTLGRVKVTRVHGLPQRPSFDSPTLYSVNADTSFAIMGRVLGIYHYRVKAMSEAGESEWGNIVTAVVDHLTINDFEDGQDPNAIGGLNSWEGPCSPNSTSGYDANHAYAGSRYGYYLAYKVTPICYATWRSHLLDKNFSGFSNVTFKIKGALGNERVHVYLHDASNVRRYVNVDAFLSARKVITDWQQATLPLNNFAKQGVNLTAVDSLQLVFEWASMNGTIYIDEVRFE